MQEKLAKIVDLSFGSKTKKSVKEKSDEARAIEEKESNMLQSYEDATARIANAIEIRDLKHDKQYM